MQQKSCLGRQRAESRIGHLQADRELPEFCLARSRTILRKLHVLISNISEFINSNLSAITRKVAYTCDKALLRKSKYKNVYEKDACYHSAQNLLFSNLLLKNVKIKIHRIIIFSVILYGCETWSLTLREESRLRVFENRVLRMIFGPKRNEVTEDWRRLHNEKLYAPYS